MRKNASLLVALLAFVTTQFVANDISASPYDLYGSGIQDAAMSATMTQASDYGALYYNPAALYSAEPTVSAGLFGTLSTGGIHLKDRPNGYDIPDIGPNSPALPTSSQIHERTNTNGPRSIYALTLGVVHNLGLKDLRVGASAFVPLNNVFQISTHFPDERERYFRNKLQWELIDKRVARLDLEFGASYQILDWLSFGLAGSYLPGASASIETYVADPTDQSDILLSSDVIPESSWALGAGIVFIIPWNIKIAVAARTGLSFDVFGRNDLQVRNVSEKERTSQPVKWRTMSTPPSLSAGISTTLDSFTLELAGKLTKWDDYLNTVNEPTNFHNTLETKLGAKYILSNHTQFMTGIQYSPSPIPEQTGRTNYVDNSRIRFSLGGAHSFHISEVPLEVAWAAQAHVLIPRDTNKTSHQSYPNCTENQTAVICDEVPNDLKNPRNGTVVKEANGLQTGNPGFPGWTSGGMIAAFQLEVRI